MALCWGEGHGSSVHDHSDAHCFVKVLEGRLKETMFDWPLTAASPTSHESADSIRVVDVRNSRVSCGGSTLGPGGGAQAPQIVATPPDLAAPLQKLWLGPKFSRTVDTLWSIDS